MRKLFPRLYIE